MPAPKAQGPGSMPRAAPPCLLPRTPSVHSSQARSSTQGMKPQVQPATCLMSLSSHRRNLWEPLLGSPTNPKVSEPPQDRWPDRWELPPPSAQPQVFPAAR